MNILLVFPHHPGAFRNFSHTLKNSSGKSSEIPLGLLTVSSLLPSHWNRRLVDLNVGVLKDKDIKWADYVFISAVPVQRESAGEIIDRCKQLDVKIVACGTLFNQEAEHFADGGHLVLNETEQTLPLFIRDLEYGSPRAVYRSDEFADLARLPVPDYSLIDHGKYAVAAVEYSRGCPYGCEFCDITNNSGHKVRSKSTYQVLKELGQLLRMGWKGYVFLACGNFIGNKRKLKSELLPALKMWMDANGHPFTFITEAPGSLADDRELINLMAGTGFSRVFICDEAAEETGPAMQKKTYSGYGDSGKYIDIIPRSLFRPSEKVLTS